MEPLEALFFRQPTLKIAEELLDNYLLTCIRGKLTGGRIVETEAYLGFEDKASHASMGKTRRNEVMYGEFGHIYVYLIYGLYHCFNIVCEDKDKPGAVLIRAVEPEFGIETMKTRRNSDSISNLTNGPGKLTKALAIDGRFNFKQLPNSKIAVYGSSKDKRKSVRSSRIGITRSKELPYRFFIKDSRFVSKGVKSI